MCYLLHKYCGLPPVLQVIRGHALRCFICCMLKAHLHRVTILLLSVTITVNHLNRLSHVHSFALPSSAGQQPRSGLPILPAPQIWQGGAGGRPQQDQPQPHSRRAGSIIVHG